MESSLVIRAIRDYYRPDIAEILVDNPEVYEQVSEFMSYVMPNNLSRLKLYTDHTPLFSRLQIEQQIETAFAVGNHQVGRQLAVGEDKLPCQREQIHHAAAHVFGFSFAGLHARADGFGRHRLHAQQAQVQRLPDDAALFGQTAGAD